jgi:hypothetical protein
VLRAWVEFALTLRWLRASRRCADEGLLKDTDVQTDRALLAGVEFVSRPEVLPRPAFMAREAAQIAKNPAKAGGDGAEPQHAPPVDGSAPFAEFRELGAGAEIVAEVLQPRPRTADPIMEARFMIPQREGAVLAAL